MSLYKQQDTGTLQMGVVAKGKRIIGQRWKNGGPNKFDTFVADRSNY